MRGKETQLAKCVIAPNLFRFALSLSLSLSRVCARVSTRARFCDSVHFDSVYSSPNARSTRVCLVSSRRSCAQATLGARRRANADDLPPTTVAICISFSTRNLVVSSPIWTIDRSNDSHGPWLSSIYSPSSKARHRLNHSLKPTEFSTVSRLAPDCATRSRARNRVRRQ